VEFTKKEQDGILTLETEYLVLTYRIDQPFAEETLSVSLKTPPATTWHFGEKPETLGGTVSTLDGVDGEIVLEDGVCARCGYAILDDSARMLLKEDGWPTDRREGTLDLYFFGYGHDYTAAVQALYRLTGAPSLLPEYALGNWWSRYHKYTQQEYLDLMDRFAKEGIPISVGVVDMDWHLTEIPDADPTYHNHSGWTGYTWNKELFPDYKEFLKELHKRGIRTALNLHPTQGVRRHEVQYEAFCRAMGKEPDGSPVYFDILDPKYMEQYFDVLHRPFEEDGVDFWWMDFQQRPFWWFHTPEDAGKVPDPCPALDPLWMLNHLHVLDIQKNGKRPMFFSRYAGPGSHRYSIGFSGDVYITWESLDFQPYFTATSANIGYGWWSHDIGGHMGGYREDELAIRWTQLGVFSPILRLHSNNKPGNTKEPWTYGPEAEQRMKEALRLRYALIPYLYAMNYRAHRDLIPLIRPMYYTHPENEAAYTVKNQYWFGDQMMVAPITQKAGESGFGKVRAWLPQGIWTDLFTGRVYDGKEGRYLDLYRDLSSIPVLCKAGAVIPLQKEQGLEWILCPGADGEFTFYEDAGDGFGYREGKSAQRMAKLEYGEQACRLILSAKGDASFIGPKEQWAKFRGFAKPEKVLLDGKSVDWDYDAKTNTIEVAIGTATECILEIQGENLAYSNADRFEKMEELLSSIELEPEWKERVRALLRRAPGLGAKIQRIPEYLRRESATPLQFELARILLELYFV
jgi:alpha-glucosidase (family GH31 glycosyl hydrolase)